MNVWLTLQLALRALLRNKARSALTMLGIVIGIASVIAMVGMGRGASTLIQQQISAMGHNLLMVLPGAASSGGFSWGAGTTTTLTPDDGAAIAREVSGVRAMTPVVRTRAQLVYGDQNWVPSSITGVGSGFVDVREWDLSEGEFFTDSDVSTSAKVCVLGATIVQNLFQGESPVGKSLRVKNIPFKVTGVLVSKGTSAMGSDQDDLVLLPWTTTKNVLQGSAFNNVDQLLVGCTTAEVMDEVTNGITGLLRERHHLREAQESDFRVLTMSEMTSTVTQTSGIMTVLLAVIASISLVVGGIGIMNIMLVSVVERTREIGLRMAVGARGRDILLQFLAEAVALSAIAGIVGMVLGAVAANVISHTLHWPTLVSPQSALIALLFSCGVGVFFGFYPAARASRLDPIEALRYE
jgi:putative ABC transport system permease protein